MIERKYEAIMLDLDGTVMAPHPASMPSPRVYDAVRQALSSDIYVSVITGRPYWMARPAIKMLGIRDVCAVNNGSQLVHPPMNSIFSEEMISAELQEEVVGLCQSYGVDVYDSENQYRGSPIEGPADVSPDGEPKLFLDSIPTRLADELIIEIAGISNLSAAKSTSWRYREKGPLAVDVHITAERATKQEAADLMIDMLDLPRSKVLGIGDGHNDIDLFKSVGMAIAMGNAPEEVKEVAHEVVPGFAEDGVAVAIQKFVLGQHVEYLE